MATTWTLAANMITFVHMRRAASKTGNASTDTAAHTLCKQCSQVPTSKGSIGQSTVLSASHPAVNWTGGVDNAATNPLHTWPMLSINKRAKQATSKYSGWGCVGHCLDQALPLRHWGWCCTLAPAVTVLHTTAGTRQTLEQSLRSNCSPHLLLALHQCRN